MIAFFVVRDFRNEFRRESDASAVQFSVGHAFFAEVFPPIETCSFVLNRYGGFVFADYIRDRNLFVCVSRIGGAFGDETEYISVRFHPFCFFFVRDTQVPVFERVC